MRDLINDGRDGRPAHVRRRAGISARARRRRPSPTGRCGRGRAARRGRLGLDQGLRLARQLPERRDDADRDLRGDEGDRRCGARAGNARSRFTPTAPPGVKDAVRAGADSVEHGIDLDDETIAEMVRRGTVWVPTIDHNRYYVDAKDEFGFAPEAIPPLQDYIQKNLESTAPRGQGAGVKLGMGSDAVYSDVRPEHARARLVRQGRHDAGAGAASATTTAATARDCRIASAACAPAFRPTSSPSKGTRWRTSRRCSPACAG